MSTNQAVVFIFFKKPDQILVEKRHPKAIFPNAILYPGGKVENNELSDIELTLLREIKEELGVKPINYIPLSTNEYIYGPTGTLLHTYIISKWEGKIPTHTLDHGNEIFWQKIDEAMNSTIPVMKILTNYLIKHLSKSS